MKHTLDRQHIEQLKAHTDLRVIAEQTLGPPRTRSRRYLQFHAPFREEKTPSLTIWADGFMDFGNPDHSGDVFTFLQLYRGMSFQEAVTFLDHSPPTSPIQATVTPVPKTPDQEWQQTGLDLVNQCVNTLWKSRRGRKILNYLKAQGYDEATIHARRLGLNRNWKKVTWSNGEHGWLPPGIVYPWFQNDQLYAIKVRAPHGTPGNPDAVAQAMGRQPEKAKYMQIAGGRISETWYGTITDTTQPTILCEGEKDCDNLHQRLGHRANVITLGSATGRLPAPLLETLAASPWIAVVLDNDEAGTRNTDRIRSRLQQILSVPVIVGHVPSGHKDITDWIIADGNPQNWFNSLQEIAAIAQFHHSPENLTYFPQGVPDVLRETLLRLHKLSERRYIKDHAVAAVVLDVYHESIIHNLLGRTDMVTVSKLVACSEELGRHCTESTIRRGMEQLCALGFFELVEKTDPELKPYINTTEEGKSEKKSRRGRPTQYYRVAPLSTALDTLLEHIGRRLREAVFQDEVPDHADTAWFDGLLPDGEAERLTRLIEVASSDLYDQDLVARVEDRVSRELDQWKKRIELASLLSTVSTPIAPEFTFANGREFRDAFYRGLVERAGSSGRQISRAQAAHQLGVTTKTLTYVRRRVGVVADPCFRDFEIKDASQVNEHTNALAPWAADRRYGRYLESSSGQRVRLSVDAPSANDVWVAAQFAQGHRVFLRVQVASRERVARPGEISHHPRSNHGSSNVRRLPVRGRQLLGAEDVCPPGFSRAYVCDQLQLRLSQLVPYVQYDTGLCQLLMDLGVLHPKILFNAA